MKKVIALVLCAVLLYQGLFNVSAETSYVGTGATVTSGDVVSGNDANEGITEEAFDVVKAYEHLIGLETDEEIVNYISTLSAEEYEVLIAYEEANRVAEDSMVVGSVPFKRNSFTNVAPLLEVTMQAVPRFYNINSRMAVIPLTMDDTDGIVSAKSSFIDANGNLTVTMEAYTTGQTITSEEETPCDIVLVLDQSGSMAENYAVPEQGEYQWVEHTWGGIGSHNPPLGARAVGDDKVYYITKDNEVTYEPLTIVDKTGFNLWYWYDYIDSEGNRYNESNKPPNGKYYTYEWVVSSGGETITRLEALKRAAKSFVDNVYANSTENVSHRIAVVGFASGGNWNGRDYDFQNTELLINGNEYQFSDSSNAAAKGQYGNALIDINSAGVTNVKNSIDALDSEGGTLINYGLEMAEEIFTAYSSEVGASNRKKVVVVLTDGTPGWSGFETAVANDALVHSSVLKNDYNASIYAISITNDADVNGTDNVNSFMNYLSSNYDGAVPTLNTSMTNPGNRNSDIDSPINEAEGDMSYYLTANNTEDLNAIFVKISSEVSTPDITLDATTVVKDIVTDYFTIPNGVSSVKVYTSAYNGIGFAQKGENGWIEQTVISEESEILGENEVYVNINGNIMSVKGFNYSANFVESGKAGGKKLVIELTAEVREGFLGGNRVPTNGSQSGIYDAKGNLMEAFQVPTVDVPISDIIVTVQDKNVYLLDDLSEDDMKTGATSTAAGNNLFDSLDWQDDYVSITHTISNEMSDLTSDGQYTVTTTIAPTSNGTATQKSDSDTANVYVYKPEITYQDSAINLGETADYETQNLVGVAWKHGSTVADTAVMGAEPVLSYTYTPTEGTFTEDTPVKVTVAIGQSDVTEHITFYRNACTFEGCANTSQTQVTTIGKIEWVNFIIHIKSFDLIIIKKGVETGDAKQAFIFRVTGPNNFSMDVIIVGNGQTKIKGLPAGDYTVTELVEWSKRYEPEKNNIAVTTDDVTSGQAEVTFVNSRNWDDWLTGEYSVANQFTINSTTK